ncbi:MAG: hypothetical protein H6815_11350 [Phycisphaeraceae bacterium]|nr:hypothetical protein [Phycisphaerales bacterium]MCB9861033.1 hypothetical protein [Phycisphaeraceae bacterium]
MSGIEGKPTRKPITCAPVIEPCRDAQQLRDYIETHWRAGHVLAQDEAMFRFTYMTPFVDRNQFPNGISVLGAYDNAGNMQGFLGAIIAPYPRPRSFWLALWHVLPELKGTGTGGALLREMQTLAVGDGFDAQAANTGWIGTFGAGPEALPVYLTRGYCARAGRRWVFDPSTNEASSIPSIQCESAPSENAPSPEWFAHRYINHPSFDYETTPNAVFRTETNSWGRVTHACWLGANWESDVKRVYERESAIAQTNGQSYLLDAWSFTCPGRGWSLAPKELPSLFHPVDARGNTTYAVGFPFIPSTIHKGDCDQDRPNLVQQLREINSAA